jgi:hypothetical protein
MRSMMRMRVRMTSIYDEERGREEEGQTIGCVLVILPSYLPTSG